MNEYIVRLNFVCSLLAPTSLNVWVGTELPQTLSNAELEACATSKSVTSRLCFEGPMLINADQIKQLHTHTQTIFFV